MLSHRDVGLSWRHLIVGLAVVLTACGTTQKTSSPTTGEAYNTGFGVVNQDVSVYSVGSIINRKNEASAYSNIFDYIRARVNGVWIDYADHGDTPNVYIRGTTSVHTPHQPMFMVDGRQVDSIADINPNDVRSVTVLKDALASLYGVQGANGVIQIWTKRGGDVD
ncbi:MAG: TonB-dependent receptor plug domain-containing protein [Bacteroidales bacterium]|nr:TonB-dependent receptor plug domain-containing protein [Bacteroidales bacterium]